MYNQDALEDYYGDCILQFADRFGKDATRIFFLLQDMVDHSFEKIEFALTEILNRKTTKEEVLFIQTFLNGIEFLDGASFHFKEASEIGIKKGESDGK